MLLLTSCQDPQPAKASALSEAPQKTQGHEQRQEDDSPAAPIPIPRIIEPESLAVTTEGPISDVQENPEQIEPTIAEEPAPAQERKWSAPQMEWDATRYVFVGISNKNYIPNAIVALHHRKNLDLKQKTSLRRLTSSARLEISSKLLRHTPSHHGICGMKCRRRNLRLKNNRNRSSLGRGRAIDLWRAECSRTTLRRRRSPFFHLRNPLSRLRIPSVRQATTKDESQRRRHRRRQHGRSSVNDQMHGTKSPASTLTFVP